MKIEIEVEKSLLGRIESDDLESGDLYLLKEIILDGEIVERKKIR